MFQSIAFLGIVCLIYLRIQLKEALSEQSDFKKQTKLERIELDISLLTFALIGMGAVGLLLYLLT